MTNDDPTLFNDLRALQDMCGSNRNDQLAVLLSASIERGIDTRSRLIAVLSCLGFIREHVAVTLEKHLGERWELDDQRRYSVMI